MPPQSQKPGDYRAERIAQRRLMAAKRAAGRELTIPGPANPRRRRRAARDPEYFCRTYMPARFKHPFTPLQSRLLREILDRAGTGGWKAIAAPRGEGKTSIIHGAISYAIPTGRLNYIIVLRANADDAEAATSDIRDEFEHNDLLAADWPEVCAPIRALEGAPSRANMQTFQGRRTRMRWTPKLLIFPTIPGSLASGAIFESHGVDKAIRGKLRRGRRPELAVIDDIETPESVRSDLITERLEKTIDLDVVGLAGQDRQIALLYPCTIMRQGCLADRYTDRTIKPAWHGERTRLLEAEPINAELWNRYVTIRRESQYGGDLTARAAHRFYLEHKPAMDAGAVLANPYRYDGQTLPDGSALEISALQHCFNLIADIGRDAFDTEYQNAPPAHQLVETANLTDAAVMGRTNGLPCGTVPHGADRLTAGIDVGGRQLYWVVVAWTSGRGAVIDYGHSDVHSPMRGRLTSEGNLEHTQSAILTALLDWRDAAAETGYPEDMTGEVRHVDCCLVDAGWQPDPIYNFVRASARGQYRAAKGYGTGTGQARYRQPATLSKGRRAGPHWHASRPAAARCWLYNIDSDWLKLYVQNGFQAPADHAGGLTLFGDDPLAHRTFAAHINAEVWTQEVVHGRGQMEYWRVVSHQNHWLDAMTLATAAAIVSGMPVLPAAPRPPAPPPTPGGPAARRPPDPDAAVGRARRQHRRYQRAGRRIGRMNGL